MDGVCTGTIFLRVEPYGTISVILWFLKTDLLTCVGMWV